VARLAYFEIDESIHGLDESIGASVSIYILKKKKKNRREEK